MNISNLVNSEELTKGADAVEAAISVFSRSPSPGSRPPARSRPSVAPTSVAPISGSRATSGSHPNSGSTSGSYTTSGSRPTSGNPSSGSDPSSGSRPSSGPTSGSHTTSGNRPSPTGLNSMPTDIRPRDPDTPQSIIPSGPSGLKRHVQGMKIIPRAESEPRKAKRQKFDEVRERIVDSL